MPNFRNSVWLRSPPAPRSLSLSGDLVVDRRREVQPASASGSLSARRGGILPLDRRRDDRDIALQRRGNLDSHEVRRHIETTPARFVGDSGPPLTATSM